MSRSRTLVMSVADLFVDHAYQRPERPTLIRRIIKEFDPAAVGALIVSERNGQAAVLDGQQRLAALKAIGKKRITCVVHTGLSPEDEARLFLLANDRIGVTRLEKFNARVASGDPAAIRIQQIAQQHGFEIGKNQGNRSRDTNRIEAVAILDKLYQTDAGLLDRTLGLLAQLWYGMPKVTNGFVIGGAGKFVQLYGAKLTDTAIDRLDNGPAPHVLMARAQASMKVYAGAGGGIAMNAEIAEHMRKIARLQRPKKSDA